MAKNKIKTAGYFIKRLRDNGYFVCRIFDDYSVADPRDWTVLINPGVESVYITHSSNKEDLGDSVFEFNDGGLNFPKNFQLSTDSIEVVLTYLNQRNIVPYYGKKENT